MRSIRYMGIKICPTHTILGMMYSANGTLHTTIEDAKKAIRTCIKPNK